jgi:hypothetical protein
VNTPAAGRRARALPLWAQLAIGAVVLVVALNLAARWLDSSLGGDRGDDTRASSYATGPEGAAAFADLVHRNGHGVERQRGELEIESLDPADTLVVLEPGALETSETAALLEFASTGGRLVIGGPDPEPYLARLTEAPPEWSPTGPVEWRGIAAELEPIAVVETRGLGSFTSLGDAQQVVAESDATLAAVGAAQRGEIVYLADVEPVLNQSLAESDNAAFALWLAGNVERTVVFAEGVHGFGSESGLDAIPTHWKIGLVVLALAALVYVLARGRRLGPPVPDAPPSPPAREEYVDAVATTLARTRDPAGATAGLRAEVEAALANVAGTDDRAAWRGAAERIGIDPSVVDALDDPGTDTSVIVVGRAFAELQKKEGAAR